MWNTTVRFRNLRCNFSKFPAAVDSFLSFSPLLSSFLSLRSTGLTWRDRGRNRNTTGRSTRDRDYARRTCNYGEAEQLLKRRRPLNLPDRGRSIGLCIKFRFQQERKRERMSECEREKKREGKREKDSGSRAGEKPVGAQLRQMETEIATK